MFSLALLNSPEAQVHWRRLMQRHASWLGVPAAFHAFTTPDGVTIDLVTMGATVAMLPDAGGTQLRIDSWMGRRAASHSSGTSLAIRITVNLTTGDMRAEVPHFAVEQLYWARDKRGLLLGTDLRPLAAWQQHSWDAHGLAALLFLGAVPAPFTLVAGIARVPNGSAWECQRQAEPKLFAQQFVYKPGTDIEPALAEERIGAALDGELEPLPQRVGLFFSGGVDSSLLAARLKGIGSHELTMLHYSFGAADRESEVASAIAKHLGLFLTRIDYRPESAVAGVEQLARNYPYPFGDFSTLSTVLLAHAAVDQHPALDVVADGTGADGAFGVGAKAALWRRVAMLPKPLRRALAGALKSNTPWRRNGLADRVWRVAARGATLSLNQAAVVAQNTFDDVAFAIPQAIRAELVQAIAQHIEAGSGLADATDQLSYLDLVHVCAGQFAAKTLGPLMHRDLRLCYPFMEERVLRVAFAMPWTVKCRGGEAKAVLKDLLRQELPESLVTRPKSGFEPPLAALLKRPDAAHLIDKALTPGCNPALELTNVDCLRTMFADARRGEPVNFAGRSFLWAHLFLAHWTSGLPRVQIVS